MRALLVALLLAHPVPVVGHYTTPTGRVVDNIHGIVPSPGCINANPFKTAIDPAETAAGLTPNNIDYYCSDHAGSSIRGAGNGPCDTIQAAPAYDANTKIERIACDFAWYVHNTQNPAGVTPEVLAHSMGGLIARYAVQRVAAADPAFPAAMNLGLVFSFASPYAGVADNTSWQTSCPQYLTECVELDAGSAFITTLDAAQPRIPWDAAGGGVGDFVTWASASDITASHTFDLDASSPTRYNHTNYLTDTSALVNEPQVDDGVAVTGQHSVALAIGVLTA